MREIPQRRKLVLLASAAAIAAAAWLLAIRTDAPRADSVAPERVGEPAAVGAGAALVAPRTSERSVPGAPASDAPTELRRSARPDAAEDSPLPVTREPADGPWPFTLLLRAVDPDGCGVADASFELAGRAVGRPRTLRAERDGTCVVELEAELRAPRLRQLLVAASAPGRVGAARLLRDEDLPQAGGILPVELVLTPAASVEVRVRDPLGRPAVGAVVRLVAADGEHRLGGDDSRRLRVEADGVARSDGFAPGKWTLQVDEWRDWAIGPYDFVELELGSANVFELVARRFDALEHASGRVVAADGSALRPEALARLRLRRVGRRVAGARLHADAVFFVPLARGAQEHWEVFDEHGAVRSAPFVLRAGWHDLEVRLSAGG